MDALYMFYTDELMAQLRLSLNTGYVPWKTQVQAQSLPFTFITALITSD